jgi:protein-histidine pros-kinase
MEIVNFQTEKLFGYSREELLGKKVEMLIPERYRENHPNKRNSFFALPRLRLIGSELTLTAIRGSEFPAEISLSPIETEDGL